ncbi:MAG: hypothetical protein FJ150_10110 [Euryarchaeota archaeon]|nr:hypothetical protein [Euryarchaeota archaeon]
MKLDKKIEECQETFSKLMGKKVLDIKFKTHNHDCWRIHLVTDKGEFVMTFCKDWLCPEVEHRTH